MTTPFTGALQRKFDAYPPHIQAAITAYRHALNERNDWMEAVAAAAEMAVENFIGGMG